MKITTFKLLNFPDDWSPRQRDNFKIYVERELNERFTTCSGKKTQEFYFDDISPGYALDLKKILSLLREQWECERDKMFPEEIQDFHVWARDKKDGFIASCDFDWEGSGEPFNVPKQLYRYNSRILPLRWYDCGSGISIELIELRDNSWLEPGKEEYSDKGEYNVCRRAHYREEFFPMFFMVYDKKELGGAITHISTDLRTAIESAIGQGADSGICWKLLGGEYVWKHNKYILNQTDQHEKNGRMPLFLDGLKMRIEYRINTGHMANPVQEAAIRAWASEFLRISFPDFEIKCWEGNYGCNTYDERPCVVDMCSKAFILFPEKITKREENRIILRITHAERTLRDLLSKYTVPTVIT